MNGKPHVHRVKVELHDYFYNWRYANVEYGDTRIRFHPPSNPRRLEAKIQKMIKKAIERHDRGSIRAAAIDAAEKRAIESATIMMPQLQEAIEADRELNYKRALGLDPQHLRQKAEVWGSEVMQ